MSKLKALGLLILLLLAPLIIAYILQIFWPNIYAEGIILFYTVTAPAWITSKWQEAAILISALTAGAGVAVDKVSKIKKTANDQVATATAQKDEMANRASEYYEKNEELTKTVEAQNTLLAEKDKQLLKLQEADSVIQQQEQEILTLRREKQEYKELLEKERTAPEVIYK